MTAKRFTYDSKTVSILKDGEFWLDGNVDTACNHSEICNELNALNDENEQLQHDATILIQSNQDYRKENEQLKHNNKMLSMKMSEVSVKYRLLKEFSDDTNPNEAVETVLHELMMITKEYR